MDITEIEEAIASVPYEVQKAIIQKHLSEAGVKGGGTTKERYGRQHFVDIRTKGWADKRAGKTKTTK